VLCCVVTAAASPHAAAVKLETATVQFKFPEISCLLLYPKLRYPLSSTLMGISISTILRIVVHDKISLIFEARVY
jgi:hypothetical protein